MLVDQRFLFSSLNQQTCDYNRKTKPESEGNSKDYLAARSCAEESKTGDPSIFLVWEGVRFTFL